jgi:3-hydroxymyristoyl/3-hydroxydecanoyl-(acyl carrier protein) dehydratase
VLLDEALHALAAHEGLTTAACRIASVKFRSPVQPGEALRLDYAATAAGDFRFEILAGDRVVTNGVLAFAAADQEDSAA